MRLKQIAIATAALLLPLAAFAQPRGGRGPGSGGPGGELPLKPGDTFPQVEVFDAAGKPFSTKSLKGKYTVVVNGCLT